MEYGTYAVSAGEYQVRTGREDLRDAFEKYLPTVRDLVDTPYGLDMMGHTMEEVLAGTWKPPVGDLSKEQQAALALPLCNALRLLVEEHGADMPEEALRQSLTSASLMLEMEPEIAWMAIRNATAWESTNRPSQGGRPYNWMGDWLKHVVSRPEWMAVYHRVRAYMRGKDA